MSNIEPPRAGCGDALERVFDAAARDRFVEYLDAARGPAVDKRNVEHVRELVQVLAASGQPPDDRWELDHYNDRRAARAALDVYVSTAEACGLLDESLVQRLRSTEERNFRSARAECLAAWFFAGKLGYAVGPVVGGGRKRKQLEFGVTTHEGQLVVEVKASRVDVPEHGHWSGDDFKALEKDMLDAAGQFGTGTRNLVVLVPRVRQPVYRDREQLEKFIGDRVMFVPIDMGDGVEVPEPHAGFVPRGRLVRFGKTAEDGTKLPAHTRVSAVVTIERGFADDARGGPYEDHRVVVVHNPNAERPIDPATFGDYPQLVKVSETEMAWTDRKGSSDDDDD